MEAPGRPARPNRRILLASVVDKARRRSGCSWDPAVGQRVVIALIIYTMTMEKLKQIATLKLIGAPDRTIIGLIVQQALILGAAGWGIGLVLILLVKDNFPRRVVLEPFNVLV
jgi:putative ABC transport system permease protein